MPTFAPTEGVKSSDYKAGGHIKSTGRNNIATSMPSPRGISRFRMQGPPKLPPAKHIPDLSSGFPIMSGYLPLPQSSRFVPTQAPSIASTNFNTITGTPRPNFFTVEADMAAWQGPRDGPTNLRGGKSFTFAPETRQGPAFDKAAVPPGKCRTDYYDPRRTPLSSFNDRLVPSTDQLPLPNRLLQRAVYPAATTLRLDVYSPRTITKADVARLHAGVLYGRAS